MIPKETLRSTSPRTRHYYEFKYGKKEMEYLKSRDRRLGEVINQIGRISWTVEPDLFSAISNTKEKDNENSCMF